VKIPKHSVRFFSGAYFVERGESFKKIIVAFGGRSFELAFGVCVFFESIYLQDIFEQWIKKKIGEK